MNGIDLAALGRIAGAAGIALGVACVVLRDLIARAFTGGALPPERAGQLALVIAGGCILLGTLALLLAWPRRPAPPAPSARPVATHGDRSPAIQGAGGAVDVNYADVPAATGAATPTPRSRASATTGVTTAGDLSPAIAGADGPVRINYGPAVAPARRSSLARLLLVFVLLGLAALALAFAWALLRA